MGIEMDARGLRDWERERERERERGGVLFWRKSGIRVRVRVRRLQDFIGEMCWQTHFLCVAFSAPNVSAFACPLRFLGGDLRFSAFCVWCKFVCVSLCVFWHVAPRQQNNDCLPRGRHLRPVVFLSFLMSGRKRKIIKRKKKKEKKQKYKNCRLLLFLCFFCPFIFYIFWVFFYLLLEFLFIFFLFLNELFITVKDAGKKKV